MRIWDLDPGFLNHKSLLGEHRELHGLVSIHVNQKAGYSHHPETRRWAGALSGLSLRHDLLVSEMTLRGFNHKSPIPDLGPDQEPEPVWPDTFIDLPAAQISLLGEKYRGKPQGRIPLPLTLGQLWASHKYSVMARDPQRYRTLGPMVAQRAISFDDLSLILVSLLRQPPPPGRLVNALDHMWGYVSDHRGDKVREPELLLSRIRARAGSAPYLQASTALGELGAWIRLRNNCAA